MPLWVEKSKCLCKFVKTFNFRTCFEIENKKSLKNCLVLRNVAYFAQDNVKWNLECVLKQKYQKYVGKAFLLAIFLQQKMEQMVYILFVFKHDKIWLKFSWSCKTKLDSDMLVSQNSRFRVIAHFFSKYKTGFEWNSQTDEINLKALYVVSFTHYGGRFFCVFQNVTISV